MTTMTAIHRGRSPEEPPYPTLRATAVFDRSFGFPAVRHGTHLVLAAGRVTDPRPFPEDEDAYLPDTSGD
ncbi:hypothetical protein ACH4GM_29835 [Streptomyces coeruleorubidus]|uniref:hypothetical protein n=1 Tax=Streptomyces coeruleorubidus TaxID=116188 RepID=UPI00379BFF67